MDLASRRDRKSVRYLIDLPHATASNQRRPASPKLAFYLGLLCAGLLAPHPSPTRGSPRPPRQVSASAIGLPQRPPLAAIPLAFGHQIVYKRPLPAARNPPLRNHSSAGREIPVTRLNLDRGSRSLKTEPHAFNHSHDRATVVRQSVKIDRRCVPKPRGRVLARWYVRLSSLTPPAATAVRLVSLTYAFPDYWTLSAPKMVPIIPKNAPQIPNNARVMPHRTAH